MPLYFLSSILKAMDTGSQVNDYKIMARVKKKKGDTTFINLPPAQLTKEGIHKMYRGKKQKRRDYIVVESNPLECWLNDARMSALMADALRNVIVKRIKAAGSVSVNKGTKKARRQWRKKFDKGNAMARYRFEGPKKLLSKDEKAEVSAGGKVVRTMKKHARPDDPPKDSAQGKWNHSGRLREGMAIKYRRPDIVAKKKGIEGPEIGEWHIYSTVNRLNGQTGNIQLASGSDIWRGDVKAWPMDKSGKGKTYQAFLEDFSSEILPGLTSDPEFIAAVRQSTTEVVQVITAINRSKRRDLAQASLDLGRELLRLYGALS